MSHFVCLVLCIHIHNSPPHFPLSILTSSQKFQAHDVLLCSSSHGRHFLLTAPQLASFLMLDSCAWILCLQHCLLVHLLLQHILNSILKRHVCRKQILQSLGLKIPLFLIINHFPSSFVRYYCWLLTSNIMCEKSKDILIPGPLHESPTWKLCPVSEIHIYMFGVVLHL